MAGAFAGGLALSAVQLGAGFAAAAEGVRQGAIPYPFASSFSFLPRNLKMLFVPGYYGDITHVPTGAAGFCGKCRRSGA